VMYVINAMGLLRISAEGENYGLDLHEHGISAYPEYVISAMGRPGGMAMEALPPQSLGAQSASARVSLPGSAH